LHVISSDLISPSLKTKRHYNTFSPRAEFFLPLASVRAWFDDEHQLAKVCMFFFSFLLTPLSLPFVHRVKVVADLAPKKYELRLKDALVCFRCGKPAKNMPALKNHLQEEFDALRKREIKY
jgi:aprataxin